MAQPYRERRQARTRGDDARERLKDAAIGIVLTQGVRALSMRALVTAAGLRNSSAVQYYFGSKEGLLKELILDFTQDIEKTKRERIESLESEGGPRTIRDVLEIYIDYPRSAFEDDLVHSRSRHYFELISISMPDLVLESIEDSPGLGSARCLFHLRRILSAVPERQLRQRLALMNLLIFAALSSREAALRQAPGGHGMWEDTGMQHTLLNALEGVLVHGIPVPSQA